MMKNILVPVDGSEGADRAIEKAVMLAQTCGAKLNFLYVANINQLAINAVLSDAILDSVTKAGNVILDRALEMVPAGVAKESFSDTGSPAVVILDFAETNDIELIVMGSAASASTSWNSRSAPCSSSSEQRTGITFVGKELQRRCMLSPQLFDVQRIGRSA